MRVTSLLSIIGGIRPEAWDAIIPHGPVLRSPLERVALNPQPLPPKEAFLVSAADLANEITRIAVELDVRGESPVGFVNELIEDWCGTPWPRKWPWPWPGPRPDQGPQPDPWDVAAARVVGAIVLANVGSRLGEGELSGALLAGAERLAEVATEG